VETRLNIFLFLAFLFILGLNYQVKNDNKIVEPKEETDFFEKQNIIQTDSIVIDSKSAFINQK
jgi:hypothetical protein